MAHLRLAQFRVRGTAAACTLWAALSVGCGGESSDDGASPGTGGSDGATLSGGSGGGDAVVEFESTVPDPGQRLVFEIAYSNFAWGSNISGYYVTRDGSAYAYNYFGDAAPAPYDSTLGEMITYRDQMTEGEITAKYGAVPELVDTLSEAEMLELFAPVGLARTGVLLSRGQLADAGEREYVAWLFDATTGLYSPVLLGADGDLARRNSVAQAEEVVQALADRLGVGRLGSYGQIDSASCDACPDGYYCVTDSQGGEHCESLYCPDMPADGINCDCQLETLCAGGRAWCQGSGAEGFTCAPPAGA